MNGRTSGQRYDTYPFIRQRIGENPARFLSENTDLNPVPRIRGIKSFDVIDAWFEVEQDIGPRREIVKHLNRQRRYLEEKQPGECFLEYWDRTNGVPTHDDVRAVATDGGEDA